MTAGTRPALRVARAAPFPARSRVSARMVAISAMTLSFKGGPAPNAPACRVRRRPPGVPCAALRPSTGFSRRRTKLQSSRSLVEETRDRALLADPLDRLGHQRRDRQLADVARHPHRLGGEDAVGR